MTWKLCHRTANLISLDGYVAELILDGSQRGTDAGGTGPDDQDIVDAWNRRRDLIVLDPRCDDIDTIPPLVYRILDQGQSPELPDDEQVLDRGLVFGCEVRCIRTGARAGHDHGDGADRTRLGAEPMANAFLSIGNDRLATQHRQNVALRADGGTSPAANAVVHIDQGMQSLGTFRIQLRFFRYTARQLVILPCIPQVATHEENRDRDGENDSNKSIHRNRDGLRRTRATSPRKYAPVPGQ